MTIALTLALCFGAAALGTALIWLVLRFLCWCWNQAFPADVI